METGNRHVDPQQRANPGAQHLFLIKPIPVRLSVSLDPFPVQGVEDPAAL
ncbi:MAG: hypothetical protein AAF907_09515 [Planctomycetota bacterium]